MKANELRVGNWVNNNEEDYQITSATIAQLERGDSEAKPIPLTEEWLIKFGFDKKFSKDKFTIIPNGKLDYEKGRTYFNAWTILEHQPEYVHQLQNLYFALTGEELSYEK
jgi:hypothetical protein